MEINGINEERSENKLAALWESQILEAQLRNAQKATQEQQVNTDAKGDEVSKTNTSSDLKSTQTVNQAQTTAYVPHKHEQDSSHLQIAKLEQSLQKSAIHVKTEQAKQAAIEAEARVERRTQAYLQAHPELKALVQEKANVDIALNENVSTKNAPKSHGDKVISNHAQHQMQANSAYNTHFNSEHAKIQAELQNQAEVSYEQQVNNKKREHNVQEQAQVAPQSLNQNVSAQNLQVNQLNNYDVEHNHSNLSQGDANSSDANSQGQSNHNAQDEHGQNKGHERSNQDNIRATNYTQDSVNNIHNKHETTEANNNFAFTSEDEDYEVKVSNTGEILSILDPHEGVSDEELALSQAQAQDDNLSQANEFKVGLSQAIHAYNEVEANDSLNNVKSQELNSASANASSAHSTLAQVHAQKSYNPHAYLTKNDEAFLNQIADRTLRGSLSKVIADARMAGTLQGPLRAESLFTSPGILSAGSAWISQMAAGENSQGKPFDGGILKLKAPIKSASELRENLIALGTNMVDALATISKMPLDLEDENTFRVQQNKEQEAQLKAQQEALKAAIEEMTQSNASENENVEQDTKASFYSVGNTMSAQSYQQERFSFDAREQMRINSMPTAQSLGIFEEQRAQDCMQTWVDNTYRELVSDTKMQDKIAAGGQEVRDFMEMLDISQRMSSLAQ